MELCFVKYHSQASALLVFLEESIFFQYYFKNILNIMVASIPLNQFVLNFFINDILTNTLYVTPQYRENSFKELLYS
jgi:hypothetical protein